MVIALILQFIFNALYEEILHIAFKLWNKNYLNNVLRFIFFFLHVFVRLGKF